MTISGQQPAMSLLESALKAQATQEEVAVALLKKSQDAQKQQGQAMIQLLEQAAPQPDDFHLDAYA